MAPTIVNVQQAQAWDGDEGADWAGDWRRYDRAVIDYHRSLLKAAAITETEAVLDIGCGNGETTRDAARVARHGSALGVDLSSKMLARARELALTEAVANVAFERADAQVHPFAKATYHAAISRFGTMFFADRVSAFANIGAALRPGGRLIMIAWRGVDANEWLQCVFAALAIGRKLPIPPPGAPGPFGLADPQQTRDALAIAGFNAIESTAIDAPLWLGHDTDDAFRSFRETGIVRGLTQSLSAADCARAIKALHATMAEHDTGNGVEFGSGAWLFTARRPSP